jgi:hypothetical protein
MNSTMGCKMDKRASSSASGVHRASYTVIAFLISGNILTIPSILQIIQEASLGGLPVTSHGGDTLWDEYTIRIPWDCPRNIAFHCIIVAIPVTVIWSTLNRFVSSVLDLGLEFGWEYFEQVSDGRLPSLDEYSSCYIIYLWFPIGCRTSSWCWQMKSIATICSNQYRKI